MSGVDLLPGQPENQMRALDGVAIDLTGRPWLQCSFANRELTRHKFDGEQGLYGCMLMNCRLIGDGWAEDWPREPYDLEAFNRAFAS